MREIIASYYHNTESGLTINQKRFIIKNGYLWEEGTDEKFRFDKNFFLWDYYCNFEISRITFDKTKHSDHTVSYHFHRD